MLTYETNNTKAVGLKSLPQNVLGFKFLQPVYSLLSFHASAYNCSTLCEYYAVPSLINSDYT